MKKLRTATIFGEVSGEDVVRLEVHTARLFHRDQFRFGTGPFEFVDQVL
jgi:hypothetical protein